MIEVNSEVISEVETNGKKTIFEYKVKATTFGKICFIVLPGLGDSDVRGKITIHHCEIMGVRFGKDWKLPVVVVESYEDAYSYDIVGLEVPETKEEAVKVHKENLVRMLNNED